MNEIKVVDNRIEQKVKPTFEEGVIESVFPAYAKVRLIGNTKVQNAYYDPSIGIEVGKNCIVTWLPNRGQYAVVACFFARGNSTSFTARLPSSLELAPPSNLQVFNFLENTLIFQWDAPPQQPVAFEIQTNTLPQESGAILRLVSRGSYYIADSATTLYARVRSVVESFARSSFTAWATGVPAPASAAGFTLAGDTGSTTIVAGDTLAILGSSGLDTSISGDSLTVAPDFTEFTSDDSFVDTDEFVYLSGSTHKRGTWAGLKNAIRTEVTTTSTGNIDNFAIGTAPVTTLVMNNATDATLRGMAAGSNGQVVIILSAGAGNVYLAHENGGSTAANRLKNIVTSLDTPLAAGKGTATYVYNSDDGRWRMVSHEQGEHISYTVTWTAATTNPAIGNGTLTGTYFIDGFNISITIAMTAGSTTTFGTGAFRFSMPATIGAGFRDHQAEAQDTGVKVYSAVGRFPTGTTVNGLDTLTDTQWDNATPFAWGNTDVARIWIEFRIT